MLLLQCLQFLCEQLFSQVSKAKCNLQYFACRLGVGVFMKHDSRVTTVISQHLTCCHFRGPHELLLCVLGDGTGISDSILCRATLKLIMSLPYIRYRTSCDNLDMLSYDIICCLFLCNYWGLGAFLFEGESYYQSKSKGLSKVFLEHQFFFSVGWKPLGKQLIVKAAGCEVFPGWHKLLHFQNTT